MTLSDVVGVGFIFMGVPFFLAGTVGLLRFPDVFTRSHALTKADNLGLGFVMIGFVVQADSWTIVLKLFLIWILILVSSAGISHLVANAAVRKGIGIWKTF